MVYERNVSESLRRQMGKHMLNFLFYCLYDKRVTHRAYGLVRVEQICIFSTVWQLDYALIHLSPVMED